MNAADPAKLSARIKAADRDIKKRAKIVRAAVAGWVEMVPVTVNKSYTYDLDEALYRNISAEIDALLASVWLDGGERNLWLLGAHVQPAYNQGAAQAITTIRAQSEAYKVTGPQVRDLLYRPEYQRRIGLVRARLFEQMKGFTDETRTDLAQTLARGMASGKGAREVAKDVERRVGVSESRAMRIARTEIATAQKAATLDETAEAAERYDLDLRMMQFSAFAATSRPEHMQRHGKVYTDQEVRIWMADGANSINCLCDFVPVVVGDDGTPLSGAIVRRAEEIKTKMEARNAQHAKGAAVARKHRHRCQCC